MIIYQRIFCGGDLMVFGGGIEGVGRRQQSIRRVLWNIYCRLTTNEGGGGVGEGWHKNITELYRGEHLLYINTHHCIPTS